jgi:hypothetical protein
MYIKIHYILWSGTGSSSSFQEQKFDFLFSYLPRACREDKTAIELCVQEKATNLSLVSTDHNNNFLLGKHSLVILLLIKILMYMYL